MLLQSFPCPNAGLQQVGLVTRRELTECVEAVNWTAKIQTPSISYAEDRGRLKVHCLRNQVIASRLEFDEALYTDIRARRHSPFPGA